jgi:hypothetical protein
VVHLILVTDEAHIACGGERERGAVTMAIGSGTSLMDDAGVRTLRRRVAALAIPLGRVMVGVARCAGAICRERDRRRMTLGARHLRVSAVREQQLTRRIRDSHRHRDSLSDLVGLSRTAAPMTRGAPRRGALGGVMTALTVAQCADRQRAMRALARMTALTVESPMLRM